MHLTVKLGTATPPSSSRKAQQRAFDRFRLESNEHRPHEALGQRGPADVYCRSTRRLPEPYWGRNFDYPEEHERARVLTPVSASAVTHVLARSKNQRKSPLLHIGDTSTCRRNDPLPICLPREKGSGHTPPFDARMAHPEDGQRGQVSSQPALHES